MSDQPYFGELRQFSFGYAPKGWLPCEGQTLAINSNQALFALLGTYYGGNGQTTFNLPDLRARVPIHVGDDEGYVVGNTGGEAAHVLTVAEIPPHSHALNASSNVPPQVAAVVPPTGNAVGSGAYAVKAGGSKIPVDRFGTGPADLTMAPGAVIPAGASQAHENRQPFLVLNWCIAVQGTFPSRN